MDTTEYSRTLLRFGILCLTCGYILNNLLSTFLGISIFLYLYLIESTSNLKIEGELERSTLKERQCSRIVFKVHGKDTVPVLDFSSPHGVLSYRVLKGKVWKYVINVIPFKKGEFTLEVKGRLHDVRGLFSTDYSASFKLQVEPSLEGLKYSIEKRSQMSLLSSVPDPEIWGLKFYEVGDDPRRIDWKRSFKVGKLIVRKLIHLEEKSVYLLLDVGSSMRRFAKRDRSKLDYALSLLLSIVEGSKGDLNIILYDDYRILKVYSDRNVKKRILEDLREIEVFQIKRYIPNVRGICEKRCNNNFPLSKSPGILQCAKLLSRMKAGTVIIITDLESNIVPLFKSVNILTRKGFKVIIYALYTPSFNLDEEDLLEEDILLRLYKHYENRRKIIKELKRRGATVIDVSYRDSIKDLMVKPCTGCYYS
ncbi:DUF58 domain-containing protein [Methanothermococcus sp. SCGC AD-155-E23]|nr:DUF58 domain-containing protein [Methanothermococcus sp. SCGC AD-155-E23]